MSDVPLSPALADPHPEDEEGERERRDLRAVNDYTHDASGRRIGGVARPEAQK